MTCSDKHTGRRDHITPVLRDLHWLPVRRRVDYKLALLVYKSLHGLAPPYLADDCIMASSDEFRRRLRSADVDTFIVPRTRLRFGDRSFSAAGPRIWNSLPQDLRRPDIELGEFRRLLKTFLFV